MFKAIRAIKKIKQLQKEMHAFSLAFLTLLNGEVNVL